EIDVAKEAIETLFDKGRSDSAANIAIELAKLGEVAIAKEAMQECFDKGWLASAAKIAIELAKLREIDTAKEVMQRLLDENSPVSAANIAIELAKLGEIDTAKEAIETLFDKGRLALAAKVAIELAKLGKTTQEQLSKSQIISKGQVYPVRLVPRGKLELYEYFKSFEYKDERTRVVSWPFCEAGINADSVYLNYRNEREFGGIIKIYFVAGEIVKITFERMTYDRINGQFRGKYSEIRDYLDKANPDRPSTFPIDMGLKRLKTGKMAGRMKLIMVIRDEDLGEYRKYFREFSETYYEIIPESEALERYEELKDVFTFEPVEASLPARTDQLFEETLNFVRGLKVSVDATYERAQRRGQGPITVTAQTNVSIDPNLGTGIESVGPYYDTSYRFIDPFIIKIGDQARDPLELLEYVRTLPLTQESRLRVEQRISEERAQLVESLVNLAMHLAELYNSDGDHDAERLTTGHWLTFVGQFSERLDEVSDVRTLRQAEQGIAALIQKEETHPNRRYTPVGGYDYVKGSLEEFKELVTERQSRLRLINQAPQTRIDVTKNDTSSELEITPILFHRRNLVQRGEIQDTVLEDIYERIKALNLKVNEVGVIVVETDEDNEKSLKHRSIDRFGDKVIVLNLRNFIEDPKLYDEFKAILINSTYIEDLEGAGLRLTAERLKDYKEAKRCLDKAL
ncbi:hypothetical protein ACFL28_05050, partial [Candidatus Omnitrophota bacterium]